jgi:hypothetical protein
MTDIVYIDEIVDAYDEARRTAWILDDRMEDYGEQAREAYEQAQKNLDELIETYAVQQGVKDIYALRKAIHAYINRQREIDEDHEDRSSRNMQRFYNDVGRLSEGEE